MSSSARRLRTGTPRREGCPSSAGQAVPPPPTEIPAEVPGCSATRGSARVEEAVQDAGTERQALQRDALVDAMKHDEVVQVGAQEEGGEAEGCDAKAVEGLGIGAARHHIRDGPRRGVF